MKTAIPALSTLLHSSTQFYMADLYTFTLSDGTIWRYTSLDRDLIYNSQVFSSSGLRFKRGRTRTVIGVQVDTLDLTIYPSSNDLINGVPFLTLLNNGGLDGARVKLERAFMESFDTAPIGAIILFLGRVSDADFSRTEAKLKIKSDLELLNVRMPRNLYQPGCIHTLYDAGCGLNKNTFAVNSTVAAGSAKVSILCGLNQADGHFSLGTIQFTSGVNAGAKRTIKQYVTGQITVSLPFANTPLIGDSFTVYPGCEKLQSTCSAKFNNLVRFRGFPYIPVPETAF